MVPACVPGSGQALLLPGQPGYVQCSAGPIEALIDGANSTYMGLLAKLDKRFSHNFAGTLSYAYASQQGYNGLIDNSNWNASYGPQAGHQTLTGAITVGLPWGFNMSGISYFVSAAPFQPFLANIDLNGNGVFSTAGESPFPGTPLPGSGFNEFGIHKDKQDLVNLVNQFNQTYAGKLDAFGRLIPTLTLPANWDLPRPFVSQDLRVAKAFNLHGERFKLTVIGECFNVFNIANKTFYNDVLNAPNFGQPSQRVPNIFGTGGPRAFQVAGRFTF